MDIFIAFPFIYCVFYYYLSNQVTAYPHRQLEMADMKIFFPKKHTVIIPDSSGKLVSISTKSNSVCLISILAIPKIAESLHDRKCFLAIHTMSLCLWFAITHLHGVTTFKSNTYKIRLSFMTHENDYLNTI